eukprot:CAMPEP_0206568426 /NCGR_PEP_ID=MMETSP0325_2-20121206/25828_1 /ASSEMBLY_ACC=CAM_ASM_000347 /TAXON_ID=2866 /ORGANISM="Crypthecodinium cohnii, Strain Seligo" /LENGTH=678 /DNA_ID=CAMNT_0054071807 /DNA_START=48 /DNA_END=2082 /DNA_ORIENTATION=-
MASTIDVEDLEGPSAASAAAAAAAAPVPSSSSSSVPASEPSKAVDRSPSQESLKSVFSFCRTPSRSPSRNSRRSRSGSFDSSSTGDSSDLEQRRKRKERSIGVDTMKITPDEKAALSMNAKTLEKIGRVAECEVFLKENELMLHIRGTPLQRRRAKKYAGLVMKQRMGPNLFAEASDDGDVTIISIPPDVVGYVQGQNGCVLRNIEEEWGTLMMFIDTDLSRAQRLIIFGSIRGRRGSELKVLSAVETKAPGYFQHVKEEIINRDRHKDSTGTWGTDYMTFKDEGEISYALGKQGGTRRKLERSSGAIVQYVGMVVLLSGTKNEREKGKEYMKWLFQQLEGPVYVDGWRDRKDCTVLDIPNDCIGYITGNRRATLGVMEEEWGTLMFFMSELEDRGSGRSGRTERLAIFGPERARRGSELKVMSGIETKSPGFFTRSIRERKSRRRGFDTDRLIFKDDEVSYALGKDGATRKKLEVASGAILQYVGYVAFIAGTRRERRRCREFVMWLLQQRRGSVTIDDISRRDDVTEVHVPTSCKGWVTGNRGSELRRIEQATGTYIFMALDGRGEERLLVFGVNPGSAASRRDGGRAEAELLIKELVHDKMMDDEGMAVIGTATAIETVAPVALGPTAGTEGVAAVAVDVAAAAEGQTHDPATECVHGTTSAIEIDDHDSSEILG